jgi:branched-chain amino acid aminotransferase
VSTPLGNPRTLVNLDGRLVPPEEALVPVLDRGFLYGDSAYEVFRTYGGVPFALGPHLDRLERTAARILLRLPERAQIEREIARTLEAAGNAESYVRIIVTRGVGEFGLAPEPAGPPRLVILVRPLDVLPASLYDKGLHLAVVPTRRLHQRTVDPRAKTGNYLNSVLALGEARAAGADDAIFLDLEGHITECSSSNIFFAKDRIVVTPPLSQALLDGVTRGLVLGLARAAGYLVREEPHGPGALKDADEVFVTSTLREVLPVTTLSILEDRDPAPLPVGDGKPGPIARALLEALRSSAGSSRAG